MQLIIHLHVLLILLEDYCSTLDIFQKKILTYNLVWHVDKRGLYILLHVRHMIWGRG